ncbi:MAG: hypothetical protein ACREEB_08955 [Caulobacteraceae bacterium]
MSELNCETSVASRSSTQARMLASAIGALRNAGFPKSGFAGPVVEKLQFALDEEIAACDNPQMFETAPTPQDSAATDPSVALAEWRLRLLEEMAEFGMKLMRTLEPGAVEAPANDKPNGKVRDPADAFLNVSRAIRLTLALHAETDQELRDLKKGVARRREAEEDAARDRRSERLHAHETKVIERMMTVAWNECETEKEFENLCDALKERLGEDLAYFDMEKRPLRETIERLCRDLTLNPDWSRWEGEGWIDDDLPSRPRFSAYNTPSARPLLHKDGEEFETPAPPWRLHSDREVAANDPVGHDLE